MEGLRPILKNAIELYLSGNHGRRLEKKMIKAILHFAFGEKPHRSNAKKEDMLDQLKMLEQKDTENRIQQALNKASGCNSSISESVGQDSHGEPLNEIVVEERGRQNGKNEQNDCNGESTVDTIAAVPEGVNKERVSDKLLQEESSDESVLDENAILCGCGNAFDLMDKCVVAGCDSCVKYAESNNHQCAKICKCRGRRVTMPARELSEKIEKDWSLWEIDTNNPDFKDLIFALPVSCACAENSFQRISRTSQQRKLSVIRGERWRKTRILRDVIQNSWTE